jgi:hypothetical protein
MRSDSNSYGNSATKRDTYGNTDVHSDTNAPAFADPDSYSDANTPGSVIELNGTRSINGPHCGQANFSADANQERQSC